jgi:BirA family biotin operon repressor/biotin-[acetyl-CoA-carboxylase] ligase
VPGLFSVEGFLANLETAYVGRSLVFLAETGSTNQEARRLAETGAPEGTLVIAEHQTAGRGRLGRRWDAPRGSSLLLSLLFRPALAPAQVQQLTMVCGLAVIEAVELETGLRLELKWPNDIVLKGAKLGGILAESGLEGERVDYVVVGVGLNVNVEASELPDDLLIPAASLSQALGRRVPRWPLLRGFLQSVEARYERVKAGSSPYGEWLDRLVTIGQPVTVSAGSGKIEGTAVGVDPDGALLVRRSDGQLQRVLAGDVTLRTGEARN